MWRDQLVPAPMRRMAVVAPESRFRRVLVETADAGVFDTDEPDDGRIGDSPSARLLDRTRIDLDEIEPCLGLDPPGELDPNADAALLLGEASLEDRANAADHLHRCAVLRGWIPQHHVESLRTRIAPFGGALAEIPVRRGLTAPTAQPDGRAVQAFRPLVTTYGTIPSQDLDPTLFAAFTYMVMFGMMFGDVAHGLAIVVLGLVAHRTRRERWRTIRAAAPFLVGAGVSAAIFGLLYGEAFGPTGLVPTLWIRPLDEPEQFLVAGLVVGSVLLAATFVIAVVNRWRESGPGVAIYDASGIAGALLFAGAAAFIGGLAASSPLWRTLGIAVAVVGALLTFVGLLFNAGPGGTGVAEAIVEMFDTVLRLGSNVVSFTRLAAFGLTHAVITEVVWDGTVALWDRGSILAVVAAAALFVFGNLAAFALGALVAAIQALRLEYYEMFSRLFAGQGRPFRPWHVPVRPMEAS